MSFTTSLSPTATAVLAAASSIATSVMETAPSTDVDKTPFLVALWATWQPTLQLLPAVLAFLFLLSHYSVVEHRVESLRKDMVSFAPQPPVDLTARQRDVYVAYKIVLDLTTWLHRGLRLPGDNPNQNIANRRVLGIPFRTFILAVWFCLRLWFYTIASEGRGLGLSTGPESSDGQVPTLSCDEFVGALVVLQRVSYGLWMAFVWDPVCSCLVSMRHISSVCWTWLSLQRVLVAAPTVVAGAVASDGVAV